MIAPVNRVLISDLPNIQANISEQSKKKKKIEVKRLWDSIEFWYLSIRSPGGGNRENGEQLKIW